MSNKVNMIFRTIDLNFCEIISHLIPSHLTSYTFLFAIESGTNKKGMIVTNHAFFCFALLLLFSYNYKFYFVCYLLVKYDSRLIFP